MDISLPYAEGRRLSNLMDSPLECFQLVCVATRSASHLRLCEHRVALLLVVSDCHRMAPQNRLSSLRRSTHKNAIRAPQRAAVFSAVLCTTARAFMWAGETHLTQENLLFDCFRVTTASSESVNQSTHTAG